jgi:hypothetical protein
MLSVCHPANTVAAMSMADIAGSQAACGHVEHSVPCLTDATCRAKLTSRSCCAATTAVILLLCRVVLNSVNDCILHLLRAVRPDIGLLIR